MLLPQIFVDDVRALRQGTGGLAPGSERERLARLADRAARSSVPVLVEGEPGSGAHAVARAIHACGERHQRPFIRLRANEATGQETQAEPILSRALREAQGGTLLIEDVEALSGRAQERLLENLQDSLAKSARSARLDVRLVAATGASLAERVRDGLFREDLYYRLQGQIIALRPLRAQREAIQDFAEALASRLSQEEGKRIRGLSAEAVTLLSRYDWPGNLRQLESALFRAVVLAESPFLTPAEFPQIAAHVQGYRVVIPPLPSATPLAPVQENPPPARQDPRVLALMSDDGEMRTLAELEEQAIRFALAHYGGRLSAISRHLGIGRSTLYRKMKELGLHDEAA